MYLRSLYSEPKGLFDEIIFQNGVNYIYGKKDDGDPKASLNSIGKSTLLDLLDFCLLSSFQRNHNRRLYAARNILSGYKIVLTFEINNALYKIKRSVDNPKIIEFGKVNNEEEYEIDNLKNILGSIIFEREEYQGKFNPKWYRNLITFYLKIQKYKKQQFTDPINYLKEINEVETNIYQLYLLGLDNSLSFENYKTRTDYKKLKPAISEIQRLIEEKYDLKSLKDANSSIHKLRYEIDKYEKAIGSFKLRDQYEDVEKEANKITQTIKDRWFQNFSDRKKIEAYEDSYNLKENISVTKIKNIYDQLSSEFAIQVKKTLAEAINYRKKLAESRKLFLKEEIEKLKDIISEREKEIDLLEKRRADIFTFLSAQEAINDLTEAFNIISEKRIQLSDIESSTKLLNDLLKEKREIEEELKKIENKIAAYIDSIQSEITRLYVSFVSIYREIYIDNSEQSNFIISFNDKKDRFLDISISISDMFGHGKNQGRTLVYDIFVILNSFSFENNFPKFLIHDGIFDGVDKAHFIAVCEYIESLNASGKKIQYITTINEEGTLSEKFGHADKVTPETIESEAIIVLSPSNKLLKKDFQNIDV